MSITTLLLYAFCFPEGRSSRERGQQLSIEEQCQSTTGDRATAVAKAVRFRNRSGFEERHDAATLSQTEERGCKSGASLHTRQGSNMMLDSGFQDMLAEKMNLLNGLLILKLLGPDSF